MPLAPTAGTNPASLDWLVVPGHASSPLRLEFPADVDDGWLVYIDGVDTPLAVTSDGDTLVLTMTAEQVEAYRDRGFVLTDPGGDPKVAGRVRRWAGRTNPPSTLQVTLDDPAPVTVTVTGAGSPGPPGPAAADAGLFAARPPAASVPVGFVWVSLDLNGGTAEVSDGAAWQPVAPAASSVSGRYLAKVAPTGDTTTVLTTAGTQYRSTAMTTPAFTMPSTPVMVFANLGRIYLGGNSATTGRMQLRYTKDAWTTSHPLSPEMAPTTVEGGYAPFYLFEYRMDPAILPPAAASGGATLAAGNTVQVALFLKHGTAAITLTVGSNVALGLAPHITVIALGS